MKPQNSSNPARKLDQEDRGENKPRPEHQPRNDERKEPHLVRMVPLGGIETDSELQCRVTVDPDTVKEYAARMAAGDKFPPLVVFEVDHEYLLVDGWHRYPAALKAGLTEFLAEIHHGTYQDAVRFAVQANATHGLPRTNKDKHRAVDIALRAFPEDSDRVIADMCKVSHVFVGKVRRQLETVTSSQSRTGRDGKRRSVPRPAYRQSKPKQGTEANADGAEANKTGSGTERRCSSSFWDEWSKIEDSLSLLMKKFPDSLWKSYLAEELRKFADRRC